jgi:hypothetical protein
MAEGPSRRFVMKYLAIAGFLTLLGFTGCGDTHKSYNYEFTMTGADACDTGDQTFITLDAMCTALQNDTVNHNCALPARMTFFTANCPDTFTEVQ